MNSYFYEPRAGHGLPHDPFKAILAPRPVGWISTIDDRGRVNLAPYSFFGGMNSNPPMIGFASEGYKDSVRNAEATREFVYNLATRPLAEAMNQTSAALPHGEDEMAFAGLAAAPSRMVRPPRVAATPAALECKVVQIVRLNDVDGKVLNSHLIIGQVVGVHIDPAYLKDGIFDTLAAQPISRCGYRGDYGILGGMFEMLRPVVTPPAG
ncbi:flavin reductase family protein [Roseomonas marmotae]|uniref:Flavin reductase family protein n=1 Tax=Roseomonas marmotae TaxID=2768161 RepID=A0ABS3K849_9PROT|nr:flavin reductase family protein [Roseomonas marmotae]MBO1073615.1 flavin reductase family protein [Roseomonas marmotae]MBO1073645.1 flavin reductase family protein [Roseomonas marmotae]QTI80205.1 flavin reductase family protein [Roseomonas marmotae]